MRNLNNKTYFKYRSLDNFDLFIDIILNKRLYATTYPLMNDPMEGLFLYNTGEISESIRSKIYNEKNNLKFCCLSTHIDDMLMWSHYANGHTGVVIEVGVSEREYDVVKLKYEKELVCYNPDVDAKTILSTKLNHWEYEDEVRVFKRNGGDNYVTIDIKKIILGRRTSERHKELIKRLVGKIDDSIEVEEIPYENYEYLKFNQ